MKLFSKASIIMLVFLIIISNPLYAFLQIFRGKIFSVSVKNAAAIMASVPIKKTRLHRTIDFAPKQTS